MTGNYQPPSTPRAGSGAGTAPDTGTGSGADSTTGTGSSGTPARRHEAWQPRVQKDPPFHSFESDAARSPDERPISGTLRDPQVDTAPLQGERDISDTDSLSNEYTPNQDDPLGAGDMPLNNRGTQTGRR